MIKFDSKKLRYSYWLTVAFIKKNFQSIALSFLLSIIGIIIFVSFSPYLLKLFTTPTEKIGLAGVYTLDTLPPDIVSKFSNGLLYLNEEGELIPLLADSWEPISDGEGYRFHIKKDLTWNDGTPFTAKDITYSFKDVETIAQNDYLLEFKLTKPLAIFPNFLTKPVIKYPLVGVAGLYKVERIKTEEGNIKELHLSPNKEGIPYLIYKFYDTDTKLIEGYKLGEITQMTTSKSNVAEVFSNWKNTEVERTIDYTRVMALFFNFNDQLIGQEKDLRQAMAMSVNKKELEAFGQQAFSPISPNSWAYNPDVKTFSYNPSLAEQLLERYQDSSASAQIKISTYYDHLAQADIIQEKLEEAGLQTTVEVLSGILPPDYQLFLAQITLAKDPDQYFFWHSTQPGNITNYKNVRIDKLLEDGRSTLSKNNRLEIYADFQRILVDDMPAYFLYHPYSYTIKRKGV